MKVSVIGTGYVGLVTGCCLAESGQTVTCIDNDKAKVNGLKSGKASIYEPGLDTLMEHNVADGRLEFTDGLKSGVKDADVIFMALPTPPNDDGSADLTILKAVATQIGEYLTSQYTVIVNKSTVPVGTASMVEELVRATAKHEVDVVSNPEFLREGQACNDFMKPERVVVGAKSKKAENVMRKLYAPFVSYDHPL
ncbi:MAG: nucleotide sugar dehydrogenase, partial [Candidatus Saccharimonadales bacterium]